MNEVRRACAGRLPGLARFRCGAIGALVALGAGMGQAMTGGSVEGKFRGDWVPSQAACSSPLKLVIGANVVTFVNGGRRADFRKLEQCFSCAAGGMTTKPQPAWLTTDAMGDSPFTIVLDGTRKTAAVSVDFSNDRKLGARFPLGTAALKRCP